MRRYALSDDQFARIEHLLPRRPGHVGRNSDKGNRLFVEAVIWKFRRALARSSRTVWRLEEYSQTIFPMGRKRRLGESIQDLSGRSEYAMIDATIVRAHQHSAGARKKGIRTKRSAARAED